MMRRGRKATSKQSIELGPARMALAAVMCVLAQSAMAQEDPVFLPDATEACVSEAYASSPGLSGHGVLDCAGRAAQACMMTPGGDNTVGMMICLEGELDYWNARASAAFAERVATAREQDAEMAQFGSAAASIERNLQRLHRTWQLFRDNACLYEQSLWMGGTGGGPATMACHMHETARQALRYEGWWSQ